MEFAGLCSSVASVEEIKARKRAQRRAELKRHEAMAAAREKREGSK